VPVEVPSRTIVSGTVPAGASISPAASAPPSPGVKTGLSVEQATRSVSAAATATRAKVRRRDDVMETSRFSGEGQRVTDLPRPTMLARPTTGGKCRQRSAPRCAVRYTAPRCPRRPVATRRRSWPTLRPAATAPRCRPGPAPATTRSRGLDRRRRHGRGLCRPPPGDRQEGRDQGAAARAGERGPSVRRALPARSAGGEPDRSPQRGRRVRAGPARRRAPVPGDGSARRRRRCARVVAARRAGAGRRRAGDLLDADRGGARRGPRPRA
jgi:hypothetical protein